MVVVGSLEIIGTIDTKRIEQGLDRVSSEVADASAKTISLKNEMMRLGGILRWVGGLLGALAIGATLLALIKDTLFANNAFRRLLETIKNLSDTIFDTFGPQIEWLIKKLDDLNKWIIENPESFKAWVKGILGIVAAIWVLKKAWAFWKWAAGAITVARTVFAKWGDDFVRLLGRLGNFFTKLGASITKFSGTLKFLGKAFLILDIFLTLADILSDFWVGIHGDWKRGLEGILKLVLGIIAVIIAVVAGAPLAVAIAIGTAVAFLVGFIIKHWDKIKEVTAKIWDWIKNKIQQDIESVKAVFTKLFEFVSVIWDKIKSIFKNPIKASVDMGSGFGDKIKGIGKKVGGFFSAQGGGFVTQPGLVNVHAGEIIAPTDKISEAITNALQGQGGSIGKTDITINVNTGDIRAEADIEMLISRIQKRLRDELVIIQRGGVPQSGL